jgi:hypothetical protein
MGILEPPFFSFSFKEKFLTFPALTLHLYGDTSSFPFDPITSKEVTGVRIVNLFPF